MTSTAASPGASFHESPSRRCLGFDWSLRSDDAAVVDRVVRLYGACPDGGPVRHRFAILTGGDPHPGVAVVRDDVVVRTVRSVDLAVAHLAWEVNRGVVDAGGDRLLLHAAAAARGDVALVLAGASGAGKSTLVAALVEAGLSYLTDEIVAVDPSDLTIDPYPKPLGLDSTGAALLPDLAAREGGPRPAAPAHWLVAPVDLSGAPLGSARDAGAGCRPRAVVVLERGATRTRLESLTRAEAAIALARDSFNFVTFGPRRLDVLAALLDGCACYRLEVGPLAGATRALLELVDARRSGHR